MYCVADPHGCAYVQPICYQSSAAARDGVPTGTGPTKRLQELCFPDGAGANQCERDYWSNHAQTCICLKYRIPVVAVLIAKR